MKFKNFTRGFTLIELLVVIAIIGILASIVLVSLSSARNKGQDAKIQEQLASMRAAAELYYSSNGNSYGTSADCTTGLFNDSASGMKNLVSASAANGAVTCKSNGTAWVASAPLSSGQWCADSTGRSASTTPDTTNDKCN